MTIDFDVEDHEDEEQTYAFDLTGVSRLCVFGSPSGSRLDQADGLLFLEDDQIYELTLENCAGPPIPLTSLSGLLGRTLKRGEELACLVLSPDRTQAIVGTTMDDDTTTRYVVAAFDGSGRRGLPSLYSCPSWLDRHHVLVDQEPHSPVRPHGLDVRTGREVVLSYPWPNNYFPRSPDGSKSLVIESGDEFQDTRVVDVPTGERIGFGRARVDTESDWFLDDHPWGPASDRFLDISDGGVRVRFLDGRDPIAVHLTGRWSTFGWLNGDALWVESAGIVLIQPVPSGSSVRVDVPTAPEDGSLSVFIPSVVAGTLENEPLIGVEDLVRSNIGVSGSSVGLPPGWVVKPCVRCGPTPYLRGFAIDHPRDLGYGPLISVSTSQDNPARTIRRIIEGARPLGSEECGFEGGRQRNTNVGGRPFVELTLDSCFSVHAFLIGRVGGVTYVFGAGRWDPTSNLIMSSVRFG